MNKTKRIISFLLTVVMVFSMTSVGVNAYYAAYKDDAILQQYNGVDQPVLTTEQYASMILDEVDRLLAEENPIINEEIYNQPFYLDFSSIDKAFDSIRTNWDLASALMSMMGDLENLNVDAIAGEGTPRRADDTFSDVDVIKAIIKFFKDNIGIFKKAVINPDSPDALDLGIFGDYLDLDFDVPNMIKGIVYKLAYDETAPKVVNETVDEMLQIILDKNLRGDLDPETGEYTGLLHELAGEVDLDDTSFYDLIDKVFRILFNDKVNKFLDEPVREWIERCVSDDPSLELLINTEYVVPTVDFNTWGNGETIFGHFNDLLGSFFESLAKPALGLTWDYSRGNDGLFDNLVNATKKVFGETGGAFFLEYIDTATFPNTEAGNKQFLTYIVRSLINALVDYINIPNDMDTIVEVANYALREVAGNYIPSQYNEYLTMDLTDIDTTFEIGADFAVYLLSQRIDLEFDYENSIYEFDFEGTLNGIVNWFLKYYGGLVDSSSGTGWARINSIIFQVIDPSWLPLDSNGHQRNDLETLIRDDVIGNLFDLDLKGVLDLFAKNPSGELNQSATYIFVSIIKNILNMIFGSGTASQYANFEAMVTADCASDPLPTLVENIINKLYSKSSGALLPALLPLVSSALKLSTPQAFEYPYVSLGDTIKGATSFYIYNASSGINTAAKNANASLHQDQLYKYRITSVSTNQSGVTVKYNGSAVNNLIVNCGKSVYLNIGGSFTNNSVLILTLKYDIIGEDGSAITSSPIEQKLYTYVTNLNDDIDQTIEVEGVDANGNELNDEKNRHKASYCNVTYINSYVSEEDETPNATRNKIISELLDVKFTFSRKSTDDEITHIKAATITQSSASVNPALAAVGVSADSATIINTTMNGGHWNVSPYAVADGATLPADGVYNSTFSYLCSPTKGKVSETLPFSHYVVIYNDANLPSLVSSEIKANRQASDYDTSNKVYTYEVENRNGGTETLTTTGPEAWANYGSALENAVKKVCIPKVMNNYNDPSFITAYTTLSNNLKKAVTALEACVNQGAGGISGLKDMVESVVPTNIDYSVEPEIDPETGEETYTYYNYYDNEYRFFGMCDYVPYTYFRFNNAKKAADKLINSKDIVDAATLSYTAHKFNLYANRLLRVTADKTVLLAVINDFGGITERGSYSQESWDKYVIARDFAAGVAAMSSDDEDLRQSLVNTAKGELILAYKTLVENADYTLLNNAIANAAFILDANEDNYTTASWAAFANAKNEALSLSRELDKTVENQNLIDGIANALNNAVANLKLKAVYTTFNTVLAQAMTYTDPSLYPVALWADFETALAAANGLSLDLDSSQQAVVDKIVSDLSQAINALESLKELGDDSKFYINDVAIPAYYGLIEYEGNYYYIKDNARIVKSKTIYISNTNGLTFSDGTPIPYGFYEFDADGKLVFRNGIQEDGRYYINGVSVPSYYGLVEWEGNLYYIRDNAQIVRSKSCYINTTNDLYLPNGKPVQHAYYDFDADGKLMMKQGVQANGKYYIDDVAVPSYYGLVEWEGDFYYIKDYAQVVRSKTCYVNTTNGLTYPNGTPVQRGNYEFDADGKMIVKQGVQADGKYYIYGSAVPSYYGLVEDGGYYYYVKDNAQIVRGKTIRINTTNGLTFPDGTPIPRGSYEFDADGRMVY